MWCFLCNARRAIILNLLREHDTELLAINVGFDERSVPDLVDTGRYISSTNDDLIVELFFTRVTVLCCVPTP
jgi:hypothetical protein